jgi:glutathione S-transferase
LDRSPAFRHDQIHSAEKFGAFLPAEPAARAQCLSWLMWQMGSAPYLGGGFGHFYAYAPTKIEYAIDRGLQRGNMIGNNRQENPTISRVVMQ